MEVEMRLTGKSRRAAATKQISFSRCLRIRSAARKTCGSEVFVGSWQGSGVWVSARRQTPPYQIPAYRKSLHTNFCLSLANSATAPNLAREGLS